MLTVCSPVELVPEINVGEWGEATVMRIKHVCCSSTDEMRIKHLHGRTVGLMRPEDQIYGFTRDLASWGEGVWGGVGELGVVLLMFLHKSQYILKPIVCRQARRPPSHLTSQVWLILLVWLMPTARLTHPEAKQGASSIIYALTHIPKTQTSVLCLSPKYFAVAWSPFKIHYPTWNAPKYGGKKKCVQLW